VDLLPIARRELYVAARKRSTFWLRVVAALVALLIGATFLILSVLGGTGLGSSALGKGLFGVLTWLCLMVAVWAGLFFTSDCLSQEKRDGTLGLLFLTSLRGYDVVLGKLLATSLRGVYAVFAVYPILAITLLMGGVTGGQFWRTLLALVSALVLSLNAGLLVSGVSRDSQKALAGTLFLLLLALGGGPAVDGLIAWAQQSRFEAFLSYSSPVHLFLSAGPFGGRGFWLGLLANQILAWVLFGGACLVLPRLWQEKAPVRAARPRRVRRWRFGEDKRRARLRRDLLAVDPVLWLLCRERWQSMSLWILVMGSVGSLLVFSLLGEEKGLYLWSYAARIVTLMLYLGVASQATRFFVEARRSGLMEMLLSTPVTESEIVRGQWRGLLRMLGGPIAGLLVAQFVGLLVLQAGLQSVFQASAPSSNAGGILALAVGGGASLAAVLMIAGNLAALSWVGMWMGVTSRSPSTATLKTVLYVQIIPWFLISVASTLFVPVFVSSLAGRAGSMVWYPVVMTALPAVLQIAKDVFFVLWARKKLFADLRGRVL